MDTNQHTTSFLTNVNNNTWNLEKMETNEHDGIILQVQDQHQIPMASTIWQNNYHHLLQIPPPSSSSFSSSIADPNSSSSSGFLSDILGIRIEEDEEPEEELGAIKEVMYQIAAMQPVDIDPATIRKPKRRNVRISDDPQSVAARHRRERISEKIRILQRLVPGGTKMDTASMLNEAIRYVKFLKRQIRLLQSTPQQPPQCNIGVSATTIAATTTTTSTLLLASRDCDWPFVPNMSHNSIIAATTTLTASMEMPARLGFNAGGHGQACDGSSNFNHHEICHRYIGAFIAHMADEDFTPEELELLDQISADLKAITRHLSNSASAGEKNSGVEPMLVNLTPSEIEATMVMKPHEHTNKDEQIADLDEESLDLVNTKKAVHVTEYLTNCRLGADIEDQLLKPFVPKIHPTECKVAQRSHWFIMMGMDSIEQILAQNDELQLMLITTVSPRLPPKPPDINYTTFRWLLGFLCSPWWGQLVTNIKTSRFLHPHSDTPPPVFLQNLLQFHRDKPVQQVEGALDLCGFDLNDDLVLAVLHRNRTDWKTAYVFFNWVSRVGPTRNGYSPSSDIYIEFIDILEKMKRFEEVDQVLDEMTKRVGLIDEAVFGSMKPDVRFYTVGFAKPIHSSFNSVNPLRGVDKLGRKFGQCQFGATFLCTSKSIPKRKIFCKEDYGDVWRDIQTMHHLSKHPHVVRIHGTYKDSMAVHLVMEVCEGGELFERSVQKGHYSEKEAAKLIKTIFEIVEAYHSLGAMHIYLKPEKFLFDSVQEDAKLKATDFGLSVFYKPGESFCDVVGSPYYVALELLRKHHGPESNVWNAGVILYILLSGVPPFWDETEPGIFRQILMGILDFQSQPWLSISDNTKDLIRRMLDQNPRTRPTAQEVFSHPWIVDDNIDPDKPFDSIVLSRLKQFSEMNKLKKMDFVVIVGRLSEEEIDVLKELFNMIDADNSGTITLDELKDGLKQRGSELMESKIKDFMDAADIESSGTIDCGEFIAPTFGAAKILGQIKPLGVEVHFIVAACENMISGTSMQPGDIVTASNGKTIEVNNTDAGCIIMLLQDDQVSCLEFFKDGKWVEIPDSKNNAIFVIMGDQIEVLRNKLYKSIVHNQGKLVIDIIVHVSLVSLKSYPEEKDIKSLTCYQLLHLLVFNPYSLLLKLIAVRISFARHIIWMIQHQLPISDATWEDYHEFLKFSPNFNLEDKVIFKGDGIVTNGNASSAPTPTNPHAKPEKKEKFG